MDDIRHCIPSKPPCFSNVLRLHIREAKPAYRTEQTSVHWIKQYICSHGKRHPSEMGAEHFET